MKNVFVIALVLLGFTLQAQPGPDRENFRKEKREKMQDLSAEQRAILKTKKMALILDLSDNQQDQVKKLVLASEVKSDEMKRNRKEKKEISKEELFELRKQRLDQKLEMKRDLKTILTKEQMEKFEKSQIAKSLKREHHRSKNKD